MRGMSLIAVFAFSLIGCNLQCDSRREDYRECEMNWIILQVLCYERVHAGQSRAAECTSLFATMPLYCSSELKGCSRFD